MPEEQLSLSSNYKSYQKQKCMLGYSHKATRTKDLLSACHKILPKHDLELDYASKHYAASGITLRQKALDLIANSRFGIYDLSSWQDEHGWHLPANVYMELGMAIGLNRPSLMLWHGDSSKAQHKLPDYLTSLEDQFVEWSDKWTLEEALDKRLLLWKQESPETGWHNLYCYFANRPCEYRDKHPKPDSKIEGLAILANESAKKGFRNSIQKGIKDYSNKLTLMYLDEMPLATGYALLLCSHCQKVRNSILVICRINKDTPPEAYIALGISFAIEAQFGTKIHRLLMVDQEQDIPSLLRGYDFIVASNDTDREEQLGLYLPSILSSIQQTPWKPTPLPFEVHRPASLKESSNQLISDEAVIINENIDNNNSTVSNISIVDSADDLTSSSSDSVILDNMSTVKSNINTIMLEIHSLARSFEDDALLDTYEQLRKRVENTETSSSDPRTSLTRYEGLLVEVEGELQHLRELRRTATASEATIYSKPERSQTRRLTRDSFKRIIDLLTPHMINVEERRAILHMTFIDNPSIISMINLQGAPNVFTTELVQKLYEFGEVAPRKPALVALLEELKDQVGIDKHRQIDTLIQEIKG